MHRLGIRVSYSAASASLRSSVGLTSSLRRCASSNNIDPADVEWVSPGTSASGGGSSSSSGPHFVDISHVDAYSRARVINFVKRYAKVDGSDGVFSVNEIRSGEQTLFHCRIKLPIPGTRDESSVLHAEGIACNAKDAEILASMHAEYTIDAMGYHIYTLPSMQRKHADTARKAGRWAPMPEDMAKNTSDVTLPLPLRRILTDDESEGGDFLLVDTTVTQFRANPYALISPCLVEPMSLHRLKACFSSHALSFDQHTSVREVDDPVTKTKWMVTTLRLPLALGYQYPFTDGENMMTATGKAKDRHMSLVLAAMHAELLLDAYGAHVFPRDPTIQELHAKAVHELGRWASTPEHLKSGLSAPSISPPPPLKQLFVQEGVPRTSIRTDEEEWVRAHVALARDASEFVAVETIDADCLSIIKRFMASNKKNKPFLFERVGTSVKATVVLPVPSAFGVRGGVGLAADTAEAQMLAANHAVNVLCALNIDMFDSAEELNAFCEKRKELHLPTPTGKPMGPETRSPPALRRGRVGGLVSVTLTNSGAPLKPEEPSIDYQAYQQEATRELWDLAPDFQDFILVDDSARARGGPSITLQHTLYSPRRMDHSASDRLVTFLASVGKRLIEVMVTKRIEDQVSKDTFQCIVKVPVPKPFGDRLAVGVAPDQRDAQTLAAMHAELILDTIGVPLYAQPDFQRKHAEAAAKLGRRAPWPGANHENPSTLSPPYLKKSSPEEISWIKMVQARGEVKAARNEASSEAPTVDAENDTAARKISRSMNSPSSSTSEDDGSSVDNVTAIALGVPKRLAYIAPEDVDAVSKLRVQYYLRRARAPQDPSVERIVLRESTVHISRLRIPVPERFGQRFAVGVASKEKEADTLLFMNAERLLDSLGIHIFNLPGLQNRHAHRVRALGRWAPLHQESVTMPASSPSPLPLSVGDSSFKPSPPVRPSTVELKRGNASSKHLWTSYIEACELYIEAFQKREANLAYQNERVPRTGLSLIDDALDEVDGQEVNNSIKQLLTQYCFRMNLSYPVFWKTQSVGPVGRRVSLTTVEVPGLEHIQAMGCAVNKEQSSRKAAMHICALLRRMEPDFVAFERDEAERVAIAASASGDDSATADASRRSSKVSSEALAAKRAAEDGSWSVTNKAFTNDGKVRVIELFTVCFALQPPVVLNKQRTEGNVVTYSTTVELTDEDGKTWVGKADAGGRKGNAADAYNDLFDQLQEKAPGFQSLAELVRNHSHLDPEHVVDVSFGEDLRQRMKELVDRRAKNDDEYNDDEEEVVAVVEERNSKADGTTENLASKLAAIDKEEIVIQSNTLKKQHLAKIASPDYQERFAAKRKSLSIHEHKREIVSTIANNQVTVVCGTTGCGKTTQLPQFILDDATERGVGGEVSMIITQPRRLSAVSIAQRIATERLEAVGESCGYTIRLDSRPGRNINFVTSGVLLRLFHSSPTLEGINYVIIDEIHERDINSDFLLILVRDLIRTRKDLRVVLMSATLSSDQFALFFGGAPVINVVGYVHPVKELFLEELADIANKQRRLTPLLKEAIDQNTSASKTEELKEALGDAAASMVMDLSNHAGSNTSQKYGFLEATGEIDYLAVQFAIDYALDQLEEISDSSILVFLPGWNEIVKAKEVLGRNTKYHIITLHSSVSSDEQMQCFQPPPEGKVKLILSTNIAESGVTIDDIAVVIDLGRAKEKSYVTRRGRTAYGRNEMGSMSQLVTVYASRANCVQRRGRVGRTRPGVCIRLYSKKHFDTVHDFQTPEMLRQPLDALCLQILALGLGDPVDFLRQAIEPPSFSHVEGAMRRLHELGGVTTKGYLTPLGLHLAKLPVAPRTGKMILVGAVLRCLDSALTIAACSDTDVYNNSREVREAVKAHREDLSNNTFSDHISSINGFNYWVTAHYTKTPQEVMVALQERQLSVPQLLTVSRYKKQFFEILCHHGFLPDANSIMQERRRDPTCQGDIFVEKSCYSKDATDVGLVKSMIGSGLFPNISMYRGKKLMRSKLDNRLAPASSSVVAQTDPEYLSSPFFVFEEVVKQAIDVKVDRLILRGVSGVPLWSVLLMGTSSMPVTYRDDLNLGIIDDWILFRASFHTLELIRRFKREFHRCLTRKFIAPNDAVNSERLEEFRCIIKELVGSSLRPNELVATSWEEKGSIVVPQTEPLPQSESSSSGDTNADGDRPIAADADDS